MSIVSIDRSQLRHYGLAGNRYYSVTTICALLHGEAQWGTQADLDRGTHLHRLFALSVAAYAGLCPPPIIPDEYQGYAASWSQWIDIAKPEPIAIEQRRVSIKKHLPFAGTFDLLCWMHDKGTRRQILMDLKSGAKARWHRVQVQAYGALVPEAERLALLYLDKEGGLPTWQIVTRDPRDWAGFCHALAILQYQETL